MTNSHSQFPPSQIRRQPQMQSVGLSRPYFGQALQLQHPTTTADSPAAAAAAAASASSSSTIQRPRSAAPSRNVSSTSLSTMQRVIIAAAKDREREYFLPDYLEGTAYGVWVSNWKNHLSTNPSLSLSSASSNGTTTNGSTAMSATAMRREASTPHTVPNSRNPSPHNHAHLVAHRGVAFDITERSSYSTSTTSSPNDPPLLPSRFNERDRCPVLELLNDGMDAKFAGPAKGTDQDAASVRADHPIPSSCGIYYYEVTIMSRGNQGFIGLGFCRASVTLNRLPGWEPESWGYHGDDGHSFCCQGIGKTYGPTFTTGDIVGCCINFRKGIAFYTKNGVELDTAFRDLTFDPPGKSGKGDFYPSIGLRTPGEHVRVNFGQKPFVFDIGGYVLREKYDVLDRVMNSPSLIYPSETENAQTIQTLIASYLAHNGYVAATRSFARDVEEEERAFGKVGNGITNGSSSLERGLVRLEEGEEKEVSRRQQIRKAILTGDIDRAISLTQTFYPTVLEKNEPIYFRLRARKFVEMMRMCADGTGPATKSIDSPDTEKMAIDSDPQEEDEQVDDEVHMTDVTPSHPTTKFVIDEEDSDDETVTPTKQQRREATLLAEALAYGQQLQEDYHDDPREEVKRVLGEAFSLLAYTDPRGSVVGHLLEESGRREVAEELNSAILVSMGKSSVAPLEMVVRHASSLVRELVDQGAMSASLINVKDDFVV